MINKLYFIIIYIKKNVKEKKTSMTPLKFLKITILPEKKMLSYYKKGYSSHPEVWNSFDDDISFVVKWLPKFIVFLFDF